MLLGVHAPFLFIQYGIVIEVMEGNITAQVGIKTMNKTGTDLNYFLPYRETAHPRTAKSSMLKKAEVVQTKPGKSHKNPVLILGNVGLVYSLASLGAPIYVGAERRKNPSFYSRLIKKSIVFSTYRSEKFIDELCEFGKTLDNKAVILSDDDDALYTISKYRERLKPYFHFLFPEDSIVNKVLDKQEFTKLSQYYELPVPASFEVSSMEDLKKYAIQCTFPCIIKPVFRSDWYHKDFTKIVGAYKKAYKCDDMDELFSMYSKVSQINKKVVLQEYIEGDDAYHYSVNVYVDKEGKLRGGYIAKKLRIYPIGAGMGSFICTVQDDELIEKSREVIDALNLRGLLNIQFKKDSRTGEPKLIEIHFRNSVWGYIGVAADINLYEYYYQGLTGEEICAQKEYRNDVKYVDLYKDIAGFFQYRSAGELSLWNWLKSFNGKMIIGDFKLSDPVPFVITFCKALFSQFSGIVKKA